MARIAFLMPTTGETPRGGFKVVFQYANLLSKDIHEVTIYYPVFLHVRTSFVHYCLRLCKALLRYLFLYLRGFSAARWFKFEYPVSEKLVFSLSSIPSGFDKYVATGSITSQYLSEIDSPAKTKYYFIQGYEPWMMSENQLLDTYRLPVTKIVISKWLKDLLANIGEHSFMVPNGFDTSEYYMTVPIEKKEPHTISMLYHTMPSKNVLLGFRALDRVKKLVPDLKVILFGVFDSPADLPEWIEYYKSPTKEEHLALNNRASIYVGTSDSEGYGLTIGEAMCCGQAVCCTDNRGYLEMAEHNVNSLVSKVGDVTGLSENIARLLIDQPLRIRLARQGYNDIQSFSLNNSYFKFKESLFQ